MLYIVINLTGEMRIYLRSAVVLEDDDEGISEVLSYNYTTPNTMQVKVGS